MRLTLTYQGPLPATQRGISPIKAALRAAFHPQIEAQIGHMLTNDRRFVTSSVDGHDFISPAHSGYRTAVDLDVLLLTAPSKRLVGDADNRLKTLIDGLTRPQNSQQMKDHVPAPGGGPTYCLLDDDQLVNRLTIDSRRWYDGGAQPSDALIVVSAAIVLGPNMDLSAPVGSMFIVL